jgi:hypothetical protein
MMIEESKYCNLFKHLNEEKILIFIEIMHNFLFYSNMLICLFLIRGVKTCKTFTLKFIIQGLL